MTVTTAQYHENERMFHGAATRAMGTRLDIVLLDVDAETGERLWKNSTDIIDRLEGMTSKFRSDSEVTAVNRAEPMSYVYVSEEFAEMLRQAARYCRLTEGAFDITLGGGSEFEFSGDALVIPRTRYTLDMGGFAKGYAVGVIERHLRANGVNTAFIDFGGSAIMGIGHHPCGDCWAVGVSDPYTGRTLHHMALNDSALSVSGNMPGHDCHIVNPATRRMVTGNRLSAICAASPLDAEALSTAWLVLDTQGRRRVLQNFDIIQEFVYN